MKRVDRRLLACLLGLSPDLLGRVRARARKDHTKSCASKVTLCSAAGEKGKGESGPRTTRKGRGRERSERKGGWREKKGVREVRGSVREIP